MPEKIARVVSAFRKAFDIDSVQEIVRLSKASSIDMNSFLENVALVVSKLNKGKTLFMPMPNLSMIENTRATVVLLANTIKRDTSMVPDTEDGFTISARMSNLLQWITAMTPFTKKSSMRSKKNNVMSLKFKLDNSFKDFMAMVLESSTTKTVSVKEKFLKTFVENMELTKNSSGKLTTAK
eukprot:3681277-Amphidinium_carterae.1